MRLRPSYDNGPVIAEGKTKILYEVVGEPDYVSIFSKDDITAGDGKKHDVIRGKGRVSNETACNIFRLLRDKEVPTAFVTENGNDSFLALKCHMFPYEIVVRRIAMGSYCERYPDVSKGTVFNIPITEYYLKTKDKRWKGYSLLCDDPYMRIDLGSETIKLFNAHAPIENQEPFLVLPVMEVFSSPDEWNYFPKMGKIARDSFHILEKAFARLGYRYADFKVECGLDSSGRVLLADLIDSDSGRLLDAEGNHLDKQYYREGGALDKLMKKFELVASLTRQFETMAA